MNEKTFEQYLEMVRDLEANSELIEEGDIINTVGIIGASAIVGMIASGLGEPIDKKIDRMESEEKLRFQHGKHDVIVKVRDGIDKIIYTTKGNSIMIFVPDTMDKDDAVQQVEEIIMKIKSKGNI